MAVVAKRVQKGDTINYTPGSAVTAGDVVVIGSIVAIAERAIAANTLGAVSIDGVYAMPKGTGTLTAIAAGAKVYWNASSEVVTETAGSNKIAGYTIEAALDADTTVDVKLSIT